MFLPRTRNPLGEKKNLKIRKMLKDDFSFLFAEENMKNYSKIQNDKCGVYTEKPIGATELHVITRNTCVSDDGLLPSIKLEIGRLYFFKFLYAKFQSCTRIFLKAIALIFN